jgi:hypothetical protein
MSVTCLKMAGRWREEEVAERLGKPASGNVVDGMGPIHKDPRQKLGALIQRELDGRSLPALETL